MYIQVGWVGRVGEKLESGLPLILVSSGQNGTANTGGGGGGSGGGTGGKGFVAIRYKFQ